MKRFISLLTLVALAAGIVAPLQAKYSFSRGFTGVKSHCSKQPNFIKAIFATELVAGALGSYWLYNNLQQETQNKTTNDETERNNNSIKDIHNSLIDGKAIPQSVYNAVEWLPESTQDKIKPLLKEYAQHTAKDTCNKDADAKSAKDAESNGKEAEKARILKSIFKLQQPLLPTNPGKLLASKIGVGLCLIDLVSLAFGFNYHATRN